MKFREVSGSDVVLGLGPWLSLRTKSQSLVLALALTRLESLVLALALGQILGPGFGPEGAVLAKDYTKDQGQRQHH